MSSARGVRLRGLSLFFLTRFERLIGGDGLLLAGGFFPERLPAEDRFLDRFFGEGIGSRPGEELVGDTGDRSDHGLGGDLEVRGELLGGFQLTGRDPEEQDLVAGRRLGGAAERSAGTATGR